MANAEFKIYSDLGSTKLEPSLLKVTHVDSVQWTVLDKGSVIRVIFEDPLGVNFLNGDTGTSDKPVRIERPKSGEYDHLICVWAGKESPRAVRAVLIVE